LKLTTDRPGVLILVAAAFVVAGCGSAAPATGGAGGGGAGDGGGGGATTGGSSGEDAFGSGGGGGVAETDAAGGDDSGTGGDDAGGGVDASCNVVVEQHDDEGAQHLSLCAPTAYRTNPPSSGNHYPTWPSYRTYDKPVPWGFLVHGLEHGAVIISYRCAPGCNVDVSAVQAFIDGLTPDNICLSRKLIVLQPDPHLDVAFAASAWTWTLRADCFDPTAFGQFIDAHYGHGLERVCGDGADLSATGWCP